MAESLYTGVTIQGLYSDQTGDQLFGVTGTTVPASALYIAGKDTTSGNLTPLSFTGGALNVNATITPPSDNISTGTLTNPGDTVTVSTAGTSQLMVNVALTAAITAGNIIFEVSTDGTLFISASLYPVFPDGNPPVATVTTAGNWQIPVGGVQKFRVRASGTFAGGPATVTLTAGQGQYSVVALSDNAANFLATVTQGTSPWVNNITQVGGSAITLGQKTSANSFPVVIASDQSAVAISGTVTANAGTGTFRVAPDGTIWTLTGTSANVDVTNTVTVTGTVAVTQSTSPWVVAGNLTHNNAAPTGNNVGVLPALANAAAPTFTEGDQVLLSTDLAGNLRTSTTISGTITVTGNKTNNNAAPNGTNVGVLGALAETAYSTVTYTTGNLVLPVTDLHGAMNTDLQAWHGTELGAATNFGTTPGAVIVGQVNASIFQGTAAISVSNTLFEQISDGTNAMGTMANFGTSPGAVKALNTNSSIYAGTTALTATGSSLNVDVTNTVTVTGTVAVTQSTSPWVVAGNLTDNNAAPTTNNVGVLPALIEAGTFPAVTLPAVNAGDQALVSVTQGRSLRIINSIDDNQANVAYYSVDSGITQKSLANATITPLFSIQSNSAAFKFTVTTVQGFTDGTLNWFALVKNPQTLTGAAFTTTGIPTGSHIKIDTTATAITIGTGTIVWSGYSSSAALINDKLMMALAAGAPGDTYTLVAEKFGTGTAKVTGVIGWRELAASI